MPIRCALYARYSSDQQRPESIADQIRHCRQEAARHPDWVVLDEHIYTDEAVSGASTEGRSGLARLVAAALQTPRAFDLILVDDTSRLARDVVDAVRHFRELRFHGVDLFFVNQGLHSGRDNAEFLLAIYGAMDSEYIRELGRKTHRGLEGQARLGLSAGGIAYGYRRETLHDPRRQDRDGQPYRVGVRWVIEPSEAAIVTTIFQQYADGIGMGTIASSLNARGISSPRQSKGHRARHDSVGNGWDVSTVRTILGNGSIRVDSSGTGRSGPGFRVHAGAAGFFGPRPSKSSWSVLISGSSTRRSGARSPLAVPTSGRAMRRLVSSARAARPTAAISSRGAWSAACAGAC